MAQVVTFFIRLKVRCEKEVRELDAKTKRYLNQTSKILLLLGIGCLFGNAYLGGSIFLSVWMKRTGAILILISYLFTAIEERKQAKSFRFWLGGLVLPIGIFFLGSLLFSLIWLCVALYRSFESFKGYLSNAVKSFRQIRDEVNQHESESGKTDSLSC